MNGRLTEAVRDRHRGDRHHSPHRAPPFQYPRRTQAPGSAPSASGGLSAQGGRPAVLIGQFGHELLVRLDAVDQPPQRDVDPARHLLPLEGPDVVRGLGDDIACQLKNLVGADVGAEAADESARVLESRLFVVLDVVEHERRHRLGIEDG